MSQRIALFILLLAQTTITTAGLAAEAPPALCVPRQDLTARTAGIVTSIHKKPADAVAVGDLIVALDDRLLVAGLKEGEAALEVARASEALAKDGFDRIQRLQASDTLSDQQKVESRLRLAQARAARAQAEAALDRLKIQIADTKIRAEVAGIVRGVPQVKGLFVQYGTSLGYVDATKADCK